MMRTWKYILPSGEFPVVKIPRGGKVLGFRFLNKVPTIWAYVNITEPEELRKFWMVETGQKMEIDPKYLSFVGTDYMDTPDGPYIIHCYELVLLGKGNILNMGMGI